MNLSVQKIRPSAKSNTKQKSTASECKKVIIKQASTPNHIG